MANAFFELEIDDNTLGKWEEIAVPEVDLFFFETIEEIRSFMPPSTLVLPRSEFNDHTSYKTIDIINSYQLWNVSKNGKYVCVIPPNIFPSLEREKKNAILRIQNKLHRGLVYNWDLLEESYKALPLSIQKETWERIESYLIQDKNETFIVFQKEMWDLLPRTFKREILLKIAESYVDDIPEMNDVVIKPTLSKYTDRFPTKNGPNCFAATLAAATDDEQSCEWILNQWVHPETFYLGLEMRGYHETNIMVETLKPNDIIVWKNENSDIIHATFHLGNDLFFNKDGQTFFNRWQIVRKADLLKNWGEKNIGIYRCEKGA